MQESQPARLTQMEAVQEHIFFSQCALPSLAGYFDAPGADAAALKALQPTATLLPETTLVFCCIEKLKDMKVKLLQATYKSAVCLLPDARTEHPCPLSCTFFLYLFHNKTKS